MNNTNKTIHDILTEFWNNIKDWDGHASKFNSTSEFYEIARKKFDQLVTEEVGKAIQGVLDEYRYEILHKSGVRKGLHKIIEITLQKLQSGEQREDKIKGEGK